MQKIAIWPSENPLLSIAIRSLISGKYESFYCNGCIFVDFSINNIRLFTDDAWLAHLKKAGLMLILISDRHLEQLALYWQLENMNIANVIYPGADILQIQRQINQNYFGLRGAAGKGIGLKRYLRPLNHEEVTFLNLLLKGMGVKDISKGMNLNIKRVYNLKAAITRKLDANLNLLLIS